jgi:limonene-1,2-epoxide hydrolase
MNSKTFAACMPVAGLIALGLSCTSASFAETPQKKSPETDNRLLLTIPFEDREDILRVMRGNLNQVKQMIGALAEDDFESVEKIANEMTFNKKKGDGLAIRGNAAYTAMGVQFHAVTTMELKEAAHAKDGKRVLRALENTLTACTSCHATFKVTEWPDNKSYSRPAPIPLNLPEGAKIRD